MEATLERALARLDDDFIRATDVIPWASPILSFGDPAASRVATLGLNPSDVEFIEKGIELDGADRRFETLASLELARWTLAGRSDRERMLATYGEYFQRNPYAKWFDPLDRILAGTGCSFRDQSNPACHLDLVPFATSVKWGALETRKKRLLLEAGTELLGAIVRDSAIEVIVVNGVGVLESLQHSSDARIERVSVEAFDLSRINGKPVRGCGYRGRLTKIGAVAFGRSVLLTGYNLNVQSSFGVTKVARSAIASWMAQEIRRS